jgi:hypothetical protein
MKLPNFKRLNVADYDEKFRDLIDTLAASLNIGIEAIYDALNKKLSLSDNFLCDVKDLQLTVDSSGIPTTTKTFQLSSSITALKGITCIKASNLTDSRLYPTGAVWVDYTITTQGVEITHVTGLQANNLYQLRIIAWG